MNSVMSKDQKYILHDDDGEDGLLWLPYKTRSTEVKIKKFYFPKLHRIQSSGYIMQIRISEHQEYFIKLKPSTCE